jgi:hypothetical protein
MAATTIEDIRDFRDVVSILEAHPEWRAELRKVLLTDELLNLPYQMTQLTAQVRELVEAQQRTEAQIATLNNRVLRMGDDVGTLKGRDLERLYREKVDIYFDSVLRNPQILSYTNVRSFLDDAEKRGALTRGERRDLGRADLIVQGNNLQTDEELYLVVEVSWGVRSEDVKRAATRAALLRKTGLQVLAVVAGEGIMPEAHHEATEKEVWQVIDGTAIPPPSTQIGS